MNRMKKENSYWLAVDGDGVAYLYPDMPLRAEKDEFWVSKSFNCLHVSEDLTKEISIA